MASSLSHPLPTLPLRVTLVTFTLSATGDAVDPYYGPIPPVGFVTFYADETPIEGCSGLLLNYDDIEEYGNYPVTCATAALSQGTHQITAAYADYFGMYNTPSLALTQNVGTIFISPDTLLDAEYNTPYSQQLTASGGTEPYTFSLLSGTLPYGITLSESGLLSGFPDDTNFSQARNLPHHDPGPGRSLRYGQPSL